MGRNRGASLSVFHNDSCRHHHIGRGRGQSSHQPFSIPASLKRWHWHIPDKRRQCSGRTAAQWKRSFGRYRPPSTACSPRRDRPAHSGAASHAANAHCHSARSGRCRADSYTRPTGRLPPPPMGQDGADPRTRPFALP